MDETTTTNGSCEEQRPLESSESPAERRYNKRKAKYTELAKKYLKENPKEEKYYWVNYRFDIGSDLDIGVYVDFTNEEIKCIHHILEDLTVEYHLTDLLQNTQEITQDENFNPSYKEILEGVIKRLEQNQPDIPSCDYGLTITDISFNATRLYKLRRIFYPKGFDKEPRIDYFLAHLKDDSDYTTLLTLKMMDRDLRFNELRHIMPEEYEYISCQAEYDDPFYSTPGPYAIEMTEVEEDVFKIIGEERVSEEIYNEADGFNGKHTYLNIKEKILAFYTFYTSCGDYEEVDNVNAIEVENAMGVSNYKGIIERIKTDFGGRDGVREFKKWLEDNSIKFQFTETHDTPNT